MAKMPSLPIFVLKGSRKISLSLMIDGKTFFNMMLDMQNVGLKFNYNSQVSCFKRLKKDQISFKKLLF